MLARTSGSCVSTVRVTYHTPVCSKVEPGVPEFGPNSEQFNSFHDCPCVCLFGLYWVGMFFVV